MGKIRYFVIWFLSLFSNKFRLKLLQLKMNEWGAKAREALNTQDVYKEIKKQERIRSLKNLGYTRSRGWMKKPKKSCMKKNMLSLKENE